MPPMPTPTTPGTTSPRRRSAPADTRCPAPDTPAATGTPARAAARSPTNRPNLKPCEPHPHMHAVFNRIQDVLGHARSAHHAQVLPRRGKHGSHRRRGRERHRLHTARVPSVRRRVLERYQISRAPPQHAPQGLLAHPHAGQHRLAVPARHEVLPARLLVAAHVGFQQHAPRLQADFPFKPWRDVAVERKGIARDHVRAAPRGPTIPLSDARDGPRQCCERRPVRPCGLPCRRRARRRLTCPFRNSAGGAPLCNGSCARLRFLSAQPPRINAIGPTRK